ncbi:MAG: DEAD/DEAH box helicase [Nocardiopsaceae bacterium]|nr:DEAD/DEAH box helicase [Nocardiopsaceae bacterium]
MTAEVGTTRFALRVTAYVLETIFLTVVPAEDTSVMPAPASAGGAPRPEDVTFASLGVPAPIVESLADGGITTPFPVQAATVPDALAGRDVLGRAQTGSGKTLGFSIPLITRLAGGSTRALHPRGLVLVPTRELATQVEAVLVPLARAMGLRVATIYGGVSYRPQIVALERATDILVACPGRLEDLIRQGYCDLSEVRVTVIDEADQMSDLGFLPIVRRLLEATEADGQRMLFSATLDGAVDVLAQRFLTDPARHSVDENSSPAEIEHHLITIGPKHRMETVAALAGGDKRSLVFTRTKHGAQRLARQLTEAGIPAAELHGNLRQGARAKNLAAFTSGIAQVMVATDIAARGIHVDGIDLVIHADPPAEHKAYVHRSGRTARGGADGMVVTLQTTAQAREVRRLMREAGVSPQRAEAEPGSEVLREIAGPLAPRVRLPKPVTEMVKLPKRHPARGSDEPRSPKGRRGGRRDDRRRDDRRSRDDQPSRENHGSRGNRSARDDRRFQDDHRSRESRSSRDDRRSRDDHRNRDDHRSHDNHRPRDNRSSRDDRTPDGHGRRGAERTGRGPRDVTPARRGGRDRRPGERNRDSWAPARRTGRPGRPDSPGGAGTAQKRRNSRQGRHF